MNHKQKLEEVRRWVIAACPEVMELKAGTPLKIFGVDATFIKKKVGMAFFYYPKQMQVAGFHYPAEFNRNVEILGSKIGIAEVLRALNTIKDTELYWSVDSEGSIYGTKDIDPVELNNFPEVDHFIKHISCGKWNLAQDDLNLASPECVDLLYSLIPKK